MTLKKLSKKLKQCTSGGVATSVVAPRIEYPKPQSYDSWSDVKDLETFL